MKNEKHTVINLDISLKFCSFDKSLFPELFHPEFKKISFDRYGYTETKMIKFTNESSGEIIQHWDYYNSIIIKGKTGLWLSINLCPTGIVTVGGGMKLKKQNIDDELSDFIKLIRIFDTNNAILFAGFNSEEVHDSKHKIVTHYKDGGSSYGWRGSSDHDFFDYLPGVYWYTYFGKDYVDCLGKEKLNNLKNVSNLHSSKGTVSFQINKPYRDYTVVDLEEIEEQIGSFYFFSKNRDVNSLKHPNGFKELLLSQENYFKDYLSSLKS
ncbi:MAG: hypothetical protein PQJ46_14745 [Spirochaetales bacterium]|nr:hypothetical protein [Spirochaetales bacterium]